MSHPLSPSSEPPRPRKRAAIDPASLRSKLGNRMRWPAFVAAGSVIVGARMGGERGDLVLCLSTAAMSAMGVVSARELLVGNSLPLPGSRFRRLSPVAMGLCALAMLAGSLAVGIELLLDRPAPTLVAKLGVGTAFVLGYLAAVAQLACSSDTWPERWKAPYQRTGHDDGAPTLADDGVDDAHSTGRTAQPPGGSA